MVVGLSKGASFVHVATTMPILGSGLLAPNSMAPAGSGSAQFQVMSSPVSSRLRFLLGEDALECLVAGWVVGDSFLPAVPDDVEPGAGEDADGVRVVVAAGDGLVVELGGPGAGAAGVAGEVGDGVAELL